MEITNLIKVLIGVATIYIVIEYFGKIVTSRRKALKKIALEKFESSNSNVISNKEAFIIAKKHFGSFDEKSYQLSKYLKENIELPVTFKPQRIKFLILSGVVIISAIVCILKSNEIGRDVFNFTRTGSVVIFYIGIITLGIGIWMLIKILKFFNHEVIIEKEELIFLKGLDKVALKYGDCSLIATPQNGLFTLNLICEVPELDNLLPVIGFIQQKEFTAILISKFIEKGKYYPTFGILQNE